MAVLAGLVALLAGPAPARAYDLQYRQNGIAFSPAELRSLFNASLPTAYDQQVPERRWTTADLLLDAQPARGWVAITLGLSPRLDQRRALLPVATDSVIEPIPPSRDGWQRLLASVVNSYGSQMLLNLERVLRQLPESP